MSLVERIERELWSAYYGEASLEKLGEIALLLLVERGNLEERMKEARTDEEKKKVEASLERIKVLEDFVRRVYYALNLRQRTVMPEKYRKISYRELLGGYEL